MYECRLSRLRRQTSEILMPALTLHKTNEVLGKVEKVG